MSYLLKENKKNIVGIIFLDFTYSKCFSPSQEGEFKEKFLVEFKEEIFLWLKIFLAIALLISWFLFWRIYENSNLLNFDSDQ